MFYKIVRAAIFLHMFESSLKFTCEGHGRLMDPPSRSSLWRFPEFAHLQPNVNVDDDSLACGGFEVQYGHNRGKCGICGDAFNETRPRANENGGLYGKGIISRGFKSGGIMRVELEVTKSHGGYWELRLCPKKTVTQKCLDKHLLQFTDADDDVSNNFQENGSGSETTQKSEEINLRTRYVVTADDGRGFNYTLSVQLPQGIKCRKCLLQWHYHTGTGSEDCDPDNSSSKSDKCGPETIYRSCADISIS